MAGYPAHIVGLLVTVALLIIALTLIFLYINSVLRFVLFDAVLRGDARIIEGWRKWRGTGRKFFAWQIIIAILGWAVSLSCIGIPLLVLFKNHHIGFWFMDATGIVVLVLAGLCWFLIAVVIAIVVVIAKDFVVPDDGPGGTWLAGRLESILLDLARTRLRVRDLFCDEDRVAHGRRYRPRHSRLFCDHAALGTHSGLGIVRNCGWSRRYHCGQSPPDHDSDRMWPVAVRLHHRFLGVYRGADRILLPGICD